ncbi:MAG: tRNA (adenosine(37)-N6)-threonylcarbamoyltransferase complex dimerization subunit type 1 TsaB [Clostridia bacterium]|nr:tRNA (adenosine(37)-N6)-threonylcarbamoyltransferase complex dimerization subunit type 1 TsaB [Deltaproteobacteria bacterium]
MADPLHTLLVGKALELGGPLLAIDTSSMTASLCFACWGGDGVVELTLPANAHGSEGIAEAIDHQRAASGITIAQLKAIIVGIGPGSFTGLRVGLAMAKGLAYGAGVPLYAVSSLAMLSASQDARCVAVALEARKGEIFAAVYEGSRALVNDRLTTPSAFANNLVSHPGVTLFADLEIPGHTHKAPAVLRAANGIALTSDRLRRSAADDVATLVPSYLKLSEPERLASRR